MKVIIQKCLSSKVMVNNDIVGSINKGLMILVGFTKNDDFIVVDNVINKIINLRIFDNMDKSIIDINGSILSVSQFTLYANVLKGRRPSFSNCLDRKKSNILYDYFNDNLAKFVNVSKGIFGADMQVSLINDGPCTIIIEK
ncbi:MAG: D-aminoacyl-tRNA deacylase [Bacilli bacterium]